MDHIRENSDPKPKAKMMRTSQNLVPQDWDIKYRGGYDKENSALAMRVAELFKVPNTLVRGVLEKWSGLKGRLEPVKKIGGVEFLNDTASTRPLATLAALQTVSENRNVILILGGAWAGDSYDELIDNLSQYVSSIVLLPGSGTLRIRKDLAMISDVPCFYAHTIEEAVTLAREHARKGDKVLFSPGFQVFGTDDSRMSRGDRFVKAVRSL
jgi:UDP-N-acetylmuramoylalanine--D-glutamate ligase